MDWKTCTLQPEWLSHWRNVLRIIRDGGIVGTSDATFKVNQANKTLTVISQVEGYSDSKVGILNDRCLKALGWKIIHIKRDDQ